MSAKTLADDPGEEDHLTTPIPIVDDQKRRNVVYTQTIPKISTKKDGSAESEARGGLNEPQENPKSPHSSPQSETPPSPSALSTSSSSSASPDIPPVMTTSGDTILPLKAKGYSFRKKKWISRYRSAKEAPAELRLLTWNVDFMGAHNDDRIRRILGYLETAILSSTPAPSIILLQELDVRSQAAILASEWVRKHYAMFPTTPEPWPHQYGNATLVSRNIPFQNAQMLRFANSRMGRTAIFVDIPIRLTDSVTRIVRIANTHLESLPEGTKMRPKQLSAIAEMLRARGVDAGVVGGDMNMIGDHRDQTIHVAAGLHDACQSPDDPSCHTWGYQPPTSFPPRRLDRVFFTGKHVCVGDVEVVGKDLRTKKGQWVSDHCGLVTFVEMHS